MSSGNSTRKRLVPSIPQKIGSPAVGHYVDWYRGSVWSTSDYSGYQIELPQGTQITTSAGHPWRGHKGFQGNIGGEFRTTKTISSAVPGMAEHHWYENGSPATGTYQENTLSAPLLPVNPAGVGFPPFINSSNSEMDQKGATAVARCQPTNSIANTTTFLGELVKDGMPRIPGISAWEGKTKLAVKAGDEFLNAVFGWAPMVNDIRNIAGGIDHASTVLRQFVRDSGRLVRRRYDFPVEENTERTLWKANTLPYMGQAVFQTQGLGRWDVYRTRKTVRKVWFSGAFTYHAPRSWIAAVANDEVDLYAKKILGLDLTPSVIWELVPWSWAIDWFSNAGDVVSNISAYQQYGLIMAYGYLMEHTITIDTYDAELVSSLPGTAPSAGTLQMITEVKQRRQAHPFGFGFSNDGLSIIQKAILAALGLTFSR